MGYSDIGDCMMKFGKYVVVVWSGGLVYVGWIFVVGVVRMCRLVCRVLVGGLGFIGLGVGLVRGGVILWYLVLLVLI